VKDALAGRIDRWVWRGTSVLPRVAETCTAFADPGSASLPAHFLSPPHGSSVEAIGWALVTAQRALPTLLAELARRGDAEAALERLPEPAVRAMLAFVAGGELRGVDVIASEGGVVPSRISGVAAFDESPRLTLLRLALALAERPALAPRVALEAIAPRSAPPANAVARAESREGQLAVDEAIAAAHPGIDALAPGGSDPLSKTSDADATPAPEDTARTQTREPGVDCAFGGMLFLLRLFQRLEIPTAVLAEPALLSAPWLAALTYAVACRLAPGAWSDPATLALAGLDAPELPSLPIDRPIAEAVLRVDARIAQATERWPQRPLSDDAAVLRAHAARLPRPVAPPDWLDELAQRLTERATSVLREAVDSDAPASALVAGVTLRAGRLVTTRTHVDLYMPLDSIDLNVRRAALDVDPGWVPHLGKVLRFHYV
jgi:hypothetical protein